MSWLLLKVVWASRSSAAFDSAAALRRPIVLLQAEVK